MCSILHILHEIRKQKRKSDMRLVYLGRPWYLSVGGKSLHLSQTTWEQSHRLQMHRHCLRNICQETPRNKPRNIWFIRSRLPLHHTTASCAHQKDSIAKLYCWKVKIRCMVVAKNDQTTRKSNLPTRNDKTWLWNTPIMTTNLRTPTQCSASIEV